MYRIRDISLLPGQDQSVLRKKAAKLLHLNSDEISSLIIRRKSVDARKKPEIRFIYTVDVTISPKRKSYQLPKNSKITPAPTDYYRIPTTSTIPEKRPVIIGFGPAGIFAGLVLARAGLCPIVVERGADVDSRTKIVQKFWDGGKLDTQCNVQFGEGGAGTFSDGKLNTGIHDIRIAWVLDEFRKAGADPSICYDAKPHIGTDILRKVVKNLRNEIISLGGEVLFDTKFHSFTAEDGRISSITVQRRGVTEAIACDRVILAIGHSARDTFAMLHDSGVPMEAKSFSMGVRVEHPQSLINTAQYGSENPLLPPADYKLNVRLPDGNSAYTFCMCPGGEVVAAASEEGGVVTNGMSYHARNGENANAALLVTLTPQDFPDPSVLGGMRWQREIEQCCFELGGGNYHAPAQTVGSFLGREAPPAVSPTYHPGVTYCDLHRALPRKITDTLEQVIPELGKKLKGFDLPGAVLTAPETRSSSPVRILRDETRQSQIRGLFPCGEGAGYAGGITSAAVDGILCAEALISSL